MPLYTIIETGCFFILRDDLIEGGTKRRALDWLLPSIHEKDCVYTGTIFGHGALALAKACEDNGKQAHLFLSSNTKDSPLLVALARTNAVLQRCEPLPIEILAEQAQTWAKQNGAYFFAPGFASPAFVHAMAYALQDFSPAPYPEIWTCAVSGVLTNTLRTLFPETRIRPVSVARTTAGEFHAPEKYHQPAKNPPPYPSCPYTDAKVWQFAKEHAAPGALIWNTAGF